jgi:cephalosporin-C deacetylase-like acetyl esterase
MRALFLALLLLSPMTAQTAEELNFTAAIGELRDMPQRLPAWLRSEAEKYLARRPRLGNADAVKARGDEFRRQLLANLGGLPERTPLNAKTVGVIERENFRIEKVIFESQPNFYVTASLYLPKRGTGPYPAILFPLGHEAGAKSHEAWQYVLGSFATKGFVALAWDPIGQGERGQFFDPDLRASRLGASTREHTMLGVQCLVTGDNIARYTIWDGIRALDYLLSRKEVDPQRVGVTGNSGGGTHTAYLAALDDRLKVAAPSCYITSWSRLLAQLGPQDAEQNLSPFLNLGYDFPDFLYAFAPKPYLILSAIRDFFPIGGARATFAEAQRVYDSLGVADKLKMVEADDGHGYTLPRRLAAYSWMSKWLKGQEDDGVEPKFPLATEAELQCTATGQVSTSLGGESVFTLNRKRAAQLRPTNSSKAQVIEAARKLSGYQPVAGVPNVTGYGTIHRKGYRIEKFIYESEPGFAVPAVLAVPDGAAGKRQAVIYADGRGKSAAASKMEDWMAKGFIVLAIDARGLGEGRQAAEGRPSENVQWFGDASSIFGSLLLGKTMVGMRALDIIRGVELLAARADVDPNSIKGIGLGAASVPLLYAAAFDGRIHTIELEGMLVSYDSIVGSRLHRRAFEQVVPGAIRRYDLPDLVAALGTQRVSLRGFVDAMGDPAPAETIRKLYGSLAAGR